MNDARAIPPKTTTAIANRLSAPAPELIISGIAPNKVDIVVMITGLNLIIDDSTIAFDIFIPSSLSWFANSTTRIPFLAINPISMRNPIWLYTFNEPPVTNKE